MRCARRWATNARADVVAVAAAAAANTFHVRLVSVFVVVVVVAAVVGGAKAVCTPECTLTPTLETTCGGALHAERVHERMHIYESCAAVNAETHCAITCVCVCLCAGAMAFWR